MAEILNKNQTFASPTVALAHISINEAIALKHSFKTPEDALAHYGKKGMKWGVRNDETGGGGSGGSGPPTELSDSDAQLIMDHASKNGLSDSQMRAKYAPEAYAQDGSKKGDAAGTPLEEPRGLSSGQKKALIALGAGAAIAGLAVYGSRQANGTYTPPADPEGDRIRAENRKKRDADLMRAAEADNERRAKLGYGFMDDYNQRAELAQRGLTDESFGNLTTEPTRFPAGHIFKRLSTVAETDIRPEGFFASANDEDLKSYKAILPTYWAKWGLTRDGGHVISMKAKEEIKAPSEKEVFDYFKRQLETRPSFLELFEGSRQSEYNGSRSDYEATAKRLWPHYAAGWASSDSPATRDLFAHLKSQGYNAVLDSNDRGVLSKNPIRLIDGSIFEITETTPLPKSEILETQLELTTRLRRERELANA